jgi:hypothetical protein
VDSYSVNWLTEYVPLRETDSVDRNSGATIRTQRGRTHDRKRELVEIAYRLIANNGLEGFRIRRVS